MVAGLRCDCGSVLKVVVQVESDFGLLDCVSVSVCSCGVRFGLILVVVVVADLVVLMTFLVRLWYCACGVWNSLQVLMRLGFLGCNCASCF